MALPKKIAQFAGKVAEFLPKSLEENAQKAWDAGNTVFAPRISDWPAGDQGPLIQRVESIGWKLEHWAVAHEITFLESGASYGSMVAFPVFRR